MARRRRSRSPRTQAKWFGDEKRGGFYSTAHDAEKLFARGKDSYDGAQPSGNGIAARNLLRLATLTADKSIPDSSRDNWCTINAATLKMNPSVGATHGRVARFHLGERRLRTGGRRKSVPTAPTPPANAEALSSDVVCSSTFQADAIKDGVQSVQRDDRRGQALAHLREPDAFGKDLGRASATVVEILIDGKVGGGEDRLPGGYRAKRHPRGLSDLFGHRRHHRQREADGQRWETIRPGQDRRVQRQKLPVAVHPEGRGEVTGV